MHEKVYCTQCHLKPVFTDVGKNCADCHADIHRRKFGANCAQCHTVLGWQVSIQSINQHFNRFPLLGAHAVVECQECHKNAAAAQYVGLSTACVSCHLPDFQKTTTPNHVSANFPSNCETCHTFDTWLNAKFDHGAVGFPLTNGHANVACVLCHINNNYNLTIAATDCGNSGCHLTTWQQTNNPVHSTAGAQFAAANCSVCHTTVSWTTANFNHSATGFALTGTHMSPAPTPCVSCHVNNNYTLTSTDCYGCHQAAFLSTTAIGGSVPNHVTAGFPTTAAACATCHPITTWAAGIFNHGATGFPLTNSHATVACALCHVNNNYSLTIAPTDCGNSGCHLTTYQATNAPSHSAAGPTFAIANCSTCHTTVNWTTATFNHSVTGFTLTGMHLSPTPTPCISCHVSNNYSLSSTACYGCHVTAWQSTTTLGGAVPNHIAAGFPTDCSICHSTTNWTSSSFNHNTTTFPLTGAHTTVACALCHVNNNYTTVPIDCYSCHTAAWQSTTTLGGPVPNHITSGYPTTCASCHTTTSWLGATFNHNTTPFPLTGAHTTVACNLCHTSATPPPTDCYSCHTAAWQSTTTLGGSVPNHIAAGYPTTCASCHTTTSWLGATFTHTLFRIPHNNATCANCHIDSTNYATFSCTASCHSKSNTDSNHNGVSGYVYGPTTCYNCHKQ